MTKRTNTSQHRSQRITPRMIALMMAYLCILVVAIRVDGTVEAQAQYQALADQAQAVQYDNLEADDTARQESLQLQQTSASLRAERLAQEQAEREEAAAESAQTTVAPAPAPVVQLKFDASNYGYTGSDKLAYWQSYNSDTIGYLRIPGTNISYPVVQNTQDVNYYTEKGYDKQYSYYGVLWTNPDTNSAAGSATMSSNTVIYGHNWTNYSSYPRIGSGNDIMFAQLTAYHHLSMARAYPYFYYSTAAEDMTFKIFACFYTEPQFNYIQTEGNTQYIIDEAMSRSRHNFNTDVNGSDKIITLSTCTRAYGATSNQRFVVMGRLLRPGESITECNVTDNPGHKQPSVW